MFETTVYAATGAQELAFRLNKFIINPLIILLFSLAFLYFMIGMLQFLRNAGNPKMRGDGQQHMLWGVLGMVIMVGVFGIINLLVNTFGIKGVDVSKQKIETQQIPAVNFSGFK